MIFNTGHGHIGWTMSIGSARIAADLISGSKPELPLEGMLVNASLSTPSANRQNDPEALAS